MKMTMTKIVAVLLVVGLITGIVVPSFASSNPLEDIKSMLSNIIYMLEDKPVIHSKELTIEDALKEHGENPLYYYRIDISSTENFQVKAVYFHLDDQDAQVDLFFVKLDMGMPYGAFYIKTDKYDPERGNPFPVELLSSMDVGLCPAGAGGDHLQICFSVQDGSVIDGDEAIYLKVIVESAQTAEISLELIPCLPI